MSTATKQGIPVTIKPLYQLDNLIPIPTKQKQTENWSPQEREQPQEQGVAQHGEQWKQIFQEEDPTNKEGQESLDGIVGNLDTIDASWNKPNQDAFQGSSDLGAYSSLQNGQDDFSQSTATGVYTSIQPQEQQESNTNLYSTSR